MNQQEVFNFNKMKTIKQKIERLYEKYPNAVDYDNKQLIQLYWREYDDIDLGLVWYCNATDPENIRRLAQAVRKENNLVPKNRENRLKHTKAILEQVLEEKNTL